MQTIIRAYDGRVKMLRACFGGGGDDGSPAPVAAEPEPVPTPAAEIRATIRALAGAKK